jgi:transposase-like protein
VTDHANGLDLAPICPRCNVSIVTPSKSHGVLEKIGRLFCLGHFRCHSCLKRFLWFMSPFARIPSRDDIAETVRIHRAGAGG